MITRYCKWSNCPSLNVEVRESDNGKKMDWSEFKLNKMEKKSDFFGRNKGEIHEECNERKGCPMFDRLFMLILGLL